MQDKFIVQKLPKLTMLPIDPNSKMEWKDIEPILTYMDNEMTMLKLDVKNLETLIKVQKGLDMEQWIAYQLVEDTLINILKVVAVIIFICLVIYFLGKLL
jgi:hypothetical protein